MTNPQTISVIVPAYGPVPHLEAVLEAVLGGAYLPDETIVSHSGSNDPTNLLARFAPRVRVIHSDAPLFAGAARNRGATLAKGEILAFCDEDTRPTAKWLKEIGATLSGDRPRFMVGSVGMARRGGYWGMCNWLSEFSEQAPWHPKRIQSGGASCNMALRRTDFEAASGFPEGQQGGEDTLLFNRLRELGLAQVFNPACEVQHFNIPGMSAFAAHQKNLGKMFVATRAQARMPAASP